MRASPPPLRSGPAPAPPREDRNERRDAADNSALWRLFEHSESPRCNKRGWTACSGGVGRDQPPRHHTRAVAHSEAANMQPNEVPHTVPAIAGASHASEVAEAALQRARPGAAGEAAAGKGV
jgi:hypothetical protein